MWQFKEVILQGFLKLGCCSIKGQNTLSCLTAAIVSFISLFSQIFQFEKISKPIHILQISDFVPVLLRIAFFNKPVHWKHWNVITGTK